MKKVAVKRVGPGSSQATRLDVIFLHGLQGDAKKTWSTGLISSKFWPEWIAQDSKLSVWSVDYPTLVTDWTGEHKLTLPQLANSIAFALRQQGIGERPLVFVAHSMGGLVAKEMIAQGRFPDRYAQPLRTACASVVFFGTPHWGADVVQRLADWAGESIDIKQTHLYELRRGSPYLENLNKAFGYWLNTDKSCTGVLAFRETQPYLGQMVVPKDSADPALGDLVQVVDLAGEDHVSMCKVKDENDDRVRQLRALCQALCSKAWQAAGKTGHVILSYHWDDTGVQDIVKRVHSSLGEAGIPLLSDLDFRTRHMAPREGWSHWRQDAVAQAHSVIVFCGPRYIEASQAPTECAAHYSGLVLAESEARNLQFGRLIPVLIADEADHRVLPSWARDFYNGMRLPTHLEHLISELCAIDPAHRDLEDQ
ncbi:TIR domain-containing protein [Paucibacter sp. DJ1R-11]|uniref:alpha/beta fold hydrolase n=1 Tax=Paucibacter sp. DJ1R-11 TaxID=2893556 RepID=UPI0021E3F871|nr:alpha/beta fold hydrolase [Paucibacter sp. DJ1R-11]MCV2362182.1 TIR domain-containing protein [Paucibacter sp. DJ1R-11]